MITVTGTTLARAVRIAAPYVRKGATVESCVYTRNAGVWTVAIEPPKRGNQHPPERRSVT